jgi:hypothetical protein
LLLRLSRHRGSSEQRGPAKRYDQKTTLRPHGHPLALLAAGPQSAVSNGRAIHYGSTRTPTALSALAGTPASSLAAGFLAHIEPPSLAYSRVRRLAAARVGGGCAKALGRWWRALPGRGVLPGLRVAQAATSLEAIDPAVELRVTPPAAVTPRRTERPAAAA